MNSICVMAFGEIGQDICRNLMQYSVYDVFSVVSPEDEVIDGIQRIEINLDKDLDKPKHEAYDDWFEENDVEFPKGYDEYIFFLSGKSDISGAVLRLAAKVGKEVQMVYSHPDPNFLSNIEKMQERVTFNVLQQYARSANLKYLLLFDVPTVEQHMKNLSVKDYFEQINKFVANYFHSWKWCENNKPVLGVFPETTEHARIGTLGVIGNQGEEFVFFPLSSFDDDVPYPSDVRYYYMIGGQRLEEDVELLPEIKNNITEKSENFNTIGYGIYEVDDGHENTLFFTKTSKIQKL